MAALVVDVWSNRRFNSALVYLLATLDTAASGSRLVGETHALHPRVCKYADLVPMKTHFMYSWISLLFFDDLLAFQPHFRAFAEHLGGDVPAAGGVFLCDGGR